MLLVTARFFRAIDDSDTLRSKFSTLCSRSQLHMFCNTVQLQYVGTETYDSNQMMSGISVALSTLKLKFQLRGKYYSCLRQLLSSLYSIFNPSFFP